MFKDEPQGKDLVVCLAPTGISVTTRSPKPRTSFIEPPNPQRTPNAPPNFCPCPVPTSANSDAPPG
ncbi:hypothetical protein H2248_008808 [Termitomyces sp. 'cryptogamus']|nr:hypothetical protein H2248_008808 [Termitomyces sp. 'cryptogamus']